MKRIELMLCAAVVAISTVIGSGVTETQAATLSGHGLSKKEKKEFTRILKKEAKKKEITLDNLSYATEWTDKGFQIKKGYAGYDSYSIQKINGKNVLCLYGNVVDAYYSCVTTCKMIYLVNGKVKTYTEEQSNVVIEGYSSKGLIIDIGDVACNYILTYKNGKIKASNYLYGDNTEEGNYAKGIRAKTKISKSEYDRIYNKYYADGKYKKIKDKSIKAFKQYVVQSVKNIIERGKENDKEYQ